MKSLRAVGRWPIGAESAGRGESEGSRLTTPPLGMLGAATVETHPAWNGPQFISGGKSDA